MSQVQAGTMRLALRGAAGVGVSGWWARPPGSLLTSQPSTSFGGAATVAACQTSAVRGLAGVPSFLKNNAFTSMFDFRKMAYPDVYDQQEALICQRYKTHGVLIERYQPPGKMTHWNPLADPELERRLKHFYKRFSARALCMRSVWGWSKLDLQTQVLNAYRNVNEALATGNLKLAEPHVTDQMLQRLAGEVARRGRRVEVKWELVDPQPSPKDVDLVFAGVAQNPLKHGRLRFVQWTVRIPSRQRVAIYDASGRLIAGDPDRVLDVVDYWVFERPVLRALLVFPRPGPLGAAWRLVERL